MRKDDCEGSGHGQRNARIDVDVDAAGQPEEYDLKKVLDVLSTVRASLDDRFGIVDASQKELKALLAGLDGKVESLAKSLEPGKTQEAGSLISAPSRSSIGSLAELTESLPVREDSTASIVINTRSGAEPCVHNGPGSGARAVTKSRRKSFVALLRGSDRVNRTSLAGFDHPQNPLQIRPGFDEPVNHRVSRPELRQCSPSTISLVQMRRLSSKGGPGGGNPYFVALNPESRMKTLYDIIGMIMVMYDAFLLPYFAAWEPETFGGSWVYTFWITCIWWTLALFVQLVTGYRNRDARLELDLGKAANHYLRTLFLPDVSVVLFDYISISGVKYFRYLRAMRLVRAAQKVHTFVNMVQKFKIQSLYLEVHLLTDISLLLIFILWVNHVACCTWWVIGRYGATDTDETWVFGSGHLAPDGSIGYEYTTSLHWALTQMTPGSMEVFPACTMERVYNALCLVLFMILASFFGATCTSSMTQYKLYKERVMNNFMQLQTYLNQQGVEPELGMAINIQVKNQIRKRQRLKWNSIVYLDHVSQGLKETLWHAGCMKCISQHVFLYSLHLFDPTAMTAICNGAIDTAYCSQGEIVFEVGGEHKEGCMYFLVVGQMYYDPGPMAPETNHPRDDELLHLRDGSFVSESSLWCIWKHLGTLFVEAPSEVLQLNAKKLQEAITHRFPEAMRIVAHYCNAFHASMHELGSVRTDLGYAIDHHDLLSALDLPIRVSLAQPILEQLRAKGVGGFGQSKVVDNLEEEIQTGKCNIGYEDAEPVRTAFVVALKVQQGYDEDTPFLVKVGDVMRANDDINPSCVLPGTKRKDKETAREAMERICKTDLAPIRPFITIEAGSEKTVFMKNSVTYGVRTRYLRTTYKALLSEAPGVPIVANTAELERGRKRRVSTNSFEPTSLSNRCRGLCCTRRRSTSMSTGRTHDDRAYAVDILCGLDYLLLLPCKSGNKAKCTVNIWLTQEQFEVLSQDFATPVIQEWLNESKQNINQSLADTSFESDEGKPMEEATPLAPQFPGFSGSEGGCGNYPGAYSANLDASSGMFGAFSSTLGGASSGHLGASSTDARDRGSVTSFKPLERTSEETEPALSEADSANDIAATI